MQSLEFQRSSGWPEFIVRHPFDAHELPLESPQLLASSIRAHQARHPSTSMPIGTACCDCITPSVQSNRLHGGQRKGCPEPSGLKVKCILVPLTPAMAVIRAIDAPCCSLNGVVSISTRRRSARPSKPQRSTLAGQDAGHPRRMCRCPNPTVSRQRA